MKYFTKIEMDKSNGGAFLYTATNTGRDVGGRRESRGRNKIALDPYPVIKTYLEGTPADLDHPSPTSDATKGKRRRLGPRKLRAAL